MQGWNVNGWGIFWMSLMMLVVWGGLAALVVVLVRSGRDRDVKKEREDATDVLRRRYAHGEISREEFDEKRHVLETTRPCGSHQSRR